MRCNSSSGMPGASRSAGHAPLGTRCHAVDGMWEHKPKCNFSRGEFRKTSSRSAAPSALSSPAGVLNRGLWGWKDGNLLPLLLQVTFASPTICNCLFHIFGLSMLPNVAKETAVTCRDNGLNIRKNTFARRGTLWSLLPAGLRPHRHQSTWNAQKGTAGIYNWQSAGKMAYRKRYVYAI